MHTKVYSGNLMERYNFGHLGIHGDIIAKRLFTTLGVWVGTNSALSQRQFVVYFATLSQ
jgi:hypothetical protein